MKKTIKNLIRISAIYGTVDINDIYLAELLNESGIKDFDKVIITIGKGKITIEKEDK